MAISGDTRFRAVNKCNYDIGVNLANGQQINIQAGSFRPITADDILYIESIATSRRPFSSGMLAIVTDDNKELTLEDIGGYTDESSEKHYREEEIEANLKKSAKSIETWLETIEDQVELYAIAEKAKAMDLSGSKLKVIQAKLPNYDILDKE